jgi:Protein of unknown function (DUF2939)
VRKLLILPFLLATLFLASWPLWSAAQLRAVIKARDLGGIESRVDWPSLRENLTRSLGRHLKESPDDGIVSALKRTLGPIVAGQMVDLAVTPRTLALVLATLGTKTGSETAEKDDEDFVSDQLSPRRVRWAFFETPTRYRIEAVARNDPTQRLVFILALQGASWKLVDVYYRSSTERTPRRPLHPPNPSRQPRQRNDLLNVHDRHDDHRHNDDRLLGA